jgi:alpha-tubulin suppressor-like RCC1 family protein
MGSNLKGQLGIGSSSSVPLTMGSPTLVEKLKHLFVEQVSCGSDFTFVVARHKQCLVNKMVYSWGNNSKGQLAQDLSLHT